MRNGKEAAKNQEMVLRRMDWSVMLHAVERCIQIVEYFVEHMNEGQLY